MLSGYAPRQEGVAEEVIYSLNLRSQRGVALVQLMNKESPKEVKRVTARAVAKKEKQEAEEELAELAVCSPEVKPLPGGRDVSDVPGVEVELDEVELVEEEVEVEDAEEQEVESSDLVEVVLDPVSEEASKEPELEIPIVKKGSGDRDALVAETRSDPSLDQWRQLADVEEQEMEASDLVKVVLDPVSEEASKEPELDIPIVKKGSGDCCGTPYSARELLPKDRRVVRPARKWLIL